MGVAVWMRVCRGAGKGLATSLQRGGEREATGRGPTMGLWRERAGGQLGTLERDSGDPVAGYLWGRPSRGADYEKERCGSATGLLHYDQVAGHMSGFGCGPLREKKAGRERCGSVGKERGKRERRRWSGGRKKMRRRFSTRRERERGAGGPTERTPEREKRWLSGEREKASRWRERDLGSEGTERERPRREKRARDPTGEREHRRREKRAGGPAGERE